MKSKIYQKQHGVVLAVTLIMLVLVTLIAVSGMTSAVMEERMAGNSQQSNMAFQMAESALREAEKKLSAVAVTEVDKASTPPYTLTGINCVEKFDSKDFTDDTTWSGGDACDRNGNSGADVGEPQYFIEFWYGKLNTESTRYETCVYRVTARGYGNDINSHATLQTTSKYICS